MNKYKIEEILSNIQFQVYSDMNFIEPLGLDKETWKELLEYINKQKEVLDKIKEYIDEHIKYECDNAFNGMQFYSYHLYDFNKEELLKLLEEII